MQDKGLIGNTPLVVSCPSETPLTYKTDKNRKIFLSSNICFIELKDFCCFQGLVINVRVLETVILT